MKSVYQKSYWTVYEEVNAGITSFSVRNFSNLVLRIEAKDFDAAVRIADVLADNAAGF